MRKIIITIDDDGRFVDISTEEFEKKTEEEVIKKDATKDITNLSIYARYFDDLRNGWNKNPEYTLVFLKYQQCYANDLLKAKGHVFLNEVYEMLDIPKTEAGDKVGWIYNKECPNGDNFIDFGLHDKQNRDFIDGLERVAILDFNVDGIITDFIED